MVFLASGNKNKHKYCTAALGPSQKRKWCRKKGGGLEPGKKARSQEF